MTRALLITGATGKQGGSVINALLDLANSKGSPDFLILGVTRNADSPSAKRLAAKSPSIKIVEGDLNEIPALFESARKTAGGAPLWGIYSVQTFMGNGASIESEIKQGKELIDESIKAGVQHFVYSSADRGGEEHSWNNPTDIPHFKSKHEIEKYLVDKTSNGKSNMGWTILRPVIFMDNLTNDFTTKVLLTAIRDTIGNKPLQWTATKDIGFFGAEAFRDPSKWNKRAFSIANDVLTFPELNQKFVDVTGKPAPTTFSIFASAFKWGVADLGFMIDWYKAEGFNANIAENRRLNPNYTTFESWLKQSVFAKTK